MFPYKGVSSHFAASVWLLNLCVTVCCRRWRLWGANILRSSRSRTFWLRYRLFETSANHLHSGPPGPNVSFVHRNIGRTVGGTLGRRSVSWQTETCELPLWGGRIQREMSVFQEEQMSTAMAQTAMRKAWSCGTPASTTQFWTKPGVQPTPPPSSRCATDKSNGKVSPRFAYNGGFSLHTIALSFIQRLVPPLLQR